MVFVFVFFLLFNFATLQNWLKNMSLVFSVSFHTLCIRYQIKDVYVKRKLSSLSQQRSLRNNVVSTFLSNTWDNRMRHRKGEQNGCVGFEGQQNKNTRTLEWSHTDFFEMVRRVHNISILRLIYERKWSFSQWVLRYDFCFENTNVYIHFNRTLFALTKITASFARNEQQTDNLTNEQTHEWDFFLWLRKYIIRYRAPALPLTSWIIISNEWRNIIVPDVEMRFLFRLRIRWTASILFLTWKCRFYGT